MCKLNWFMVLVLSLTTAGIVHAEVKNEPEARTAIMLNKSERDLVLLEMRIFLQSVQQIISGVTEDDMEQIVKAARKSGRAAQQAVPASLAAKLPKGFKTLGFDTHSKFDELALHAEQLGDGEHALSQLKELMVNCVACHETYSFELEANTAK